MKLYKARFNQRAGTPDSELAPNPVQHYPACQCLAPQFGAGTWRELALHADVQDTRSDAWKALAAYIEKVRVERLDELNPRDGIGSDMWEQIITLPPSIGGLQSVRVLMLYGSHLVRIPPEIGQMANLEELDVYTSYCLHWLPYEITHCKNLTRSRVSTRALYGNFKYRAPFPRLPSISADLTPESCSICGGPFTEYDPLQFWVSLRIATDVLPLLVHACSSECAGTLPQGARGYVQEAHRGGLELKQPPKSSGLPK